MADYGNNNQKQAAAYAPAQPRPNETALMIEGLYNGIAYDLQKMKKEILNELKYASMQNSAVYQSIQQETNNANAATENAAQEMVLELKYGYQQNQMIYESLSGVLNDEVVAKLNTIEGKVEMLEQIDAAMAEIKAKVEELSALDYDSLAEYVRDKVVEVLPVQEELDYDRITESVMEKAETSITAHNKEVLDAVAAIPVAENVDYSRIVEEVSDKVIEKIQEFEKPAEAPVQEVNFDYDRVIYGAAEKVVESLPYPEKVDYRRINDSFMAATEGNKLDEEVLAANVAAAVVKAIAEEFNADALAETVVAKMPAQETIDYDKLAEAVAAKMPVPEEIDYDRLAEVVVAKMPAPEEIDYDRLADAVAARIPVVDYDRVTQIVADEKPVFEAFDYAVMAETVVERLPVQEKAEAIDYDRVYQAAKAAEVTPDGVDYDRIAELVNAKLTAQREDVDELAAKIAEKIVLPQPAPVTYDVVVDEAGAKTIAQNVVSEINVDEVADKIAEKVEVPQPEALDYELLSDKVAEKVVVPEAEEIDYELVSDRVAEKIVVPQAEALEVDYEKITDGVIEKMPTPCYDVVVDEAGAEAIAEAVAEKLCARCAEEKACEEPAEEAPVEETIEEVVEEVEEEVVEEAPVEEPVPEPVEEVEETPVVEEIAPAESATVYYEEVNDDLVDADTGMVVRLKKSFTAKLRQSKEEVKDYYSRIKNALGSYKRLNSNISWHGDRFNYGRETVAKMNICGKTLCLYLALDPNDPELKQSVYHQKDVGESKSYANTPFMVKVKSDMGAKKAVRLVHILAEKKAAQAKEGYEPVDYVEVFAHESTKNLLDQGLIKITREKKVVLDFI